MELNFQPLIDDVKAIFEAAYNNSIPKIKELGEGYLNSRIERLEGLAEYTLTSGFDDGFVLKRLSEEPKILLQELESFKVAGLQISQDTANEAITTITAALLDMVTEAT